MNALAWQRHAACKGLSLELFFGPPESERYDQAAKERREARAKAICATCPVETQCLAYALGQPEKYGIYGGLNEEERAAERRRRTRRDTAAARRQGAAA